MDDVDWDRVAELREEVGEDSFAEVLSLFLEEMDEAVDSLKAGAPDTGKLHFLKGAALNLGLTRLAALSSDGETRLKWDPAETVPTAPLLEAYRAAKAELIALCAP